MAPCLLRGSTEHSTVIVLELAEGIDTLSLNPVPRAEYTQPRPRGQKEPAEAIRATPQSICEGP